MPALFSVNFCMFTNILPNLSCIQKFLEGLHVKTQTQNIVGTLIKIQAYKAKALPLYIGGATTKIVSLLYLTVFGFKAHSFWKQIFEVSEIPWKVYRLSMLLLKRKLIIWNHLISHNNDIFHIVEQYTVCIYILRQRHALKSNIFSAE